MARVKADKILEAAAKTFAERNAVYKDNYYMHGKIMRALYPTGIYLENEHDFVRFGVINMIVSKLGRYVSDKQHPHIDSVHDMIVYAAILEGIDLDAK